MIRYIVDMLYGVSIYNGEIRNHFVDNPEITKQELIREVSDFLDTLEFLSFSFLWDDTSGIDLLSEVVS